MSNHSEKNSALKKGGRLKFSRLGRSKANPARAGKRSPQNIY